MAEDDAAARHRAALTEAQRRWRERTAGRTDGDGETDGAAELLGGSVTLHLTDRECAVLDMIAAQLYRDNPHDPVNGVVSPLCPGRPEAVRELIRMYRRSTKIRRPASREACADFWRRESAFRRARKRKTKAERPVPPW